MTDTKEHVQTAFDFDAPARLLLTIPQAAYVLAIGRSTLYELIGTGDMEVVHVGRAARIPVEAVVRYVERLRRAA